MKKSFLAFFLLASTAVSAIEITKEQYDDLYEAHKDYYEEVKSGMTAEYHSSIIVQTETKEEQCLQYEKEIILSTEHARKYLVYRKIRNLTDCLSEKKDTIKESLEWRELYRIGTEAPVVHFRNDFTKIIQNESLINVELTRHYLSGGSKKISYQVDLSKSQFFNVIDSNYGNISSRLLRRGMTDPSSINIENLEVSEESL